jgi:hypothetical protein
MVDVKALAAADAAQRLQDIADIEAARAAEAEEDRRRTSAALTSRERLEYLEAKLPSATPTEQDERWLLHRSPTRRAREQAEIERRAPLDCALIGVTSRAEREARAAAEIAADQVRQAWNRKCAEARAAFERGDERWQEILK